MSNIDTEDGSNEYKKGKIDWDIEWRESSNPRVKFCSDQEFFDSQVIPTEAKGLYDKYIKETDTTKLEKKKAKNGKEYYVTNWSFNDTKNSATYSATYDDQYAWGIMKVPLKESTQESKARMERIENKCDKILSMLEKMKA